MKNNFIYKSIFILVLLMIFVHTVEAATLTAQATKSSSQTSDLITLPVYLGSGGDYINAVEGDLIYDSDLVTFEGINLGTSFINFWVEKPRVVFPGKIHFSGITPGGVNSNMAEVFTVVFRSNNIGNANFSLTGVKLLLNDGEGTLVKTSTQGSTVHISRKTSEDSDQKYTIEDIIAPEGFTILRSRNNSFFENKYFIAFGTSDKGSGVASYRVCEFFSCVDGDSPHILRNQSPFYWIKVSAYDMNGNKTSSSIISNPVALLMLVVFGVVAYVIYRFWRKYL